jgi:hypothetical protein
MAMNSASDAPNMLRPAVAKAAAIASIVLGALAAATILALWVLASQGTTPSYAPWWSFPIFAALGAIVIILGVAFLLGREWAQPVLLAWFSAIAGAEVVQAIMYMLDKGGAAKVLPFSATIVTLICLAIIAITVGMIMLAWSASRKQSRLRFASNVVVTIALALTLLVVANVVAQSAGNYWRKDLQLLGQYGLSERSRKVFKGVNEPVRLTVLYSTAEPNMAERASRVWELVSEIGDLNPRVQVARATSEADRAAAITRAAQQARDRAPAHAKLINEFLAESQRMRLALRKEANQWQGLAGDSYLDLWAAAAQVGDVMRSLLQEQEELASRLPKELAGMPDYAKLADDVKSLAVTGKTSIAGIEQTIGRLAKIPGAVAAHRQAVEANLDEVSAAVREAQQALAGAPASDSAPARRPSPATAPADPTLRLRRYLQACDRVIVKATDASKALDEIAGTENARLIRNSRPWSVAGEQRPMIIDNRLVMSRPNLTGEFLGLASTFKQQQAEIEGILQRETKESQAQVVASLRQAMAEIEKAVAELRQSADEAMTRLASVDAATAELFKRVRDGKLLQDLLQPYTRLAEEAEKLPALAGGTLAADMGQENVVLVETADKTEAVTFDQAWPLVARARDAEMTGAASQRLFAGDSALASKVLAMTQRPCATVVFTYMELPPQIAQMTGGEGGFTPRMLEELQIRLRQANFRVKTWDLSKTDEPADMDEPNAAPLPKVLLILPPPTIPPEMTRQEDSATFGPRQVEAVRRLLDSGQAAGAIFLASFQPPAGPYAQPAPYGWNNYLGREWGIRARTDQIVIPAKADDQTGTRLRLDSARVRMLPVNTFSDHPIGRPLQGQRVFWQLPCPVMKTDHVPAGISVQSLLTVPEYWTHTWATNNVLKISQQIYEGGGFVSPDYDKGDTKAPFDLAMAATRKGEPNAPAAARVVVMGLADSMRDSYVAERAPTLEEDGTVVYVDPPRANLDLIVNSAYWLCGRQDYIASGPVQIQPLRNIPRSTYWTLWALCVVALPAAVLAAGGVVLLTRRK